MHFIDRALSFDKIETKKTYISNRIVIVYPPNFYWKFRTPFKILIRHRKLQVYIQIYSSVKERMLKVVEKS